jgi:multiple sugar transport system permease protein/alpha-1,4-digalacturonate transport system permease protein
VSRRLRRRNTLVGWSFILPNFVGFAVLTLVPVGALFYVAFTNWNAFGVADWVGLENFRQILHDHSFRVALINTAYYTVLHIPLTLALALALALLLNNKLRGVAFFRTAAFFPYVTSIVAIAVVWNMLFSPDSGPINQLLRAIGIRHPPGWTASADWSMPAVIVVGTWREMGYYMLLFLAGLQTIPRELYEAARMDGAGAWHRFRNVTVPGLRPTTFFVTVVLTIGSFKVFDLILVMTNGGPGQSTLVLSQYIYTKGFMENQLGYASSVSVVFFLICITVTLVQFGVNRRSQS